MRGILAGCCATTITPIASSAIATKIDDRPAWFIFHTLFLPGLSRYKGKEGSESWRDLQQRNATRVGRPALKELLLALQACTVALRSELELNPVQDGIKGNRIQSLEFSCKYYQAILPRSTCSISVQ